jgi:hypothetical protein
MLTQETKGTYIPAGIEPVIPVSGGASGSVVVETLRYKPEGHGFEIHPMM